MAWHQGQAYGKDLRDRVLNSTGSIVQVAARFGVSKSYVARARPRRRRLAVDTPGEQHNHVPLKLAHTRHTHKSTLQTLPGDHENIILLAPNLEEIARTLSRFAEKEAFSD